MNRSTIINALRAAFEPRDDVRAFFLGGSEAFGRTDEWSDADCYAVCARGGAEAVFAAAEAALAAIAPIELKERIPAPTWHGHEQCFYRLAGAPEWLLVDLCVIERGRENAPPIRAMEVERHGTPTVLFDKDGCVQPTNLDRAELDRRIRARVDELERRFALFSHMASKSVRRRDPAQAAHFYLQFVLRPLVEMLRILHCPERFDYALRYIRSDLPPDEAALVERLSLPASLEDLLAKQEEAEAAFARALRAWRAGARREPYARES